MSYTRANSQTFIVSGSWVAPGNVTIIALTGFGGGGGGGSGTGKSIPGGTISNGAGGGGALQSSMFVSVIPGALYTITIGAGGTGGAGVANSVAAGNNGGPGGDTIFALSGSAIATFGGASGGSGGLSNISGLIVYPGAGQCIKGNGGVNLYATVVTGTSNLSSAANYIQGIACGGVVGQSIFAGSGNLNLIGGFGVGKGGSYGYTGGGSTYTYYYGGAGGGAGPGGTGTNGAPANVTGSGSNATNAPNNSGAGGGGSGGAIASGNGGNGGSGSLTVSWGA